MQQLNVTIDNKKYAALPGQTLLELAQENGMSRRTFERRFKIATGGTPLRYLQRVRVEAARNILEEKDSSFDGSE